MSKYEKEMVVAQDVARIAGKIMLKHFDGNQQTEYKDDGSPVTIADKKINSMVIDELTFKFPEYGVVGEEESTTGYGMGTKWFCDPIDGTIAYTWGVPTSMFSLGLVVDGEPQMGVAYDPYLDRMYTAVRGEGSFCNGDEIKVSELPLDKGIVATTADSKRISRGVPYIQELAKTSTHLATFSGAVYKSALVAKGRFEGYIEEMVNGHDMAAVELIVEEAGGKVTGLDGQKLNYTKPFKGAVVSNGIVHQELLDLLGQDN
jgi:fructose-1,6-bisphosphatase/inositol monophosphatase family enzyme